VRRFAAIAAVALLAAACGAPSTNVVYSRAASSACLGKQGVQLRAVPDSDFVGRSATGGAFRAVLGANDVTVSFGLTLEDAENIDQAYRRFHAKNVGINDVLRMQGSAVMLWQMHPSDADLSTITGCLKK
jgi:hypothetical protein